MVPDLLAPGASLPPAVPEVHQHEVETLHEWLGVLACRAHTYAAVAHRRGGRVWDDADF